ncbi:MAG TPA: DNA polymerase III subunit chi [Paracoccaceae bacterium]|nr:DNA polymerase III subunit chi [Paracoccaceae bacterium]
MGTALFYHLTRSTPDQTAGMLLPRAVAQGWRVVVRGGDPARIAALDDHLWLHPDDGFLPHGVAGGAHDADQPVLLGGPGLPVAGAQAVMLLDGATATPDEARALQRVWVLFDGGDEGAVAQARALWSALTGAGIGAQYWSEEGGRWQMKTERAAAPGA